MPRRYSDEQVEAMMVPQIVSAIYPVLIPVEQQDCAIQAKNHERMTALATELWRSFRDPDAAIRSTTELVAELAKLRVEYCLALGKEEVAHDKRLAELRGALEGLVRAGTTMGGRYNDAYAKAEEIARTALASSSTKDENQ